ncbi:DNA replication initiation protein [Vagococcus entomophilus]|uniref:DNA replication initiation protein n=1 Tax=Vagococcus entomophilus TaxID=1160095 RepID=A0A430AG19_9ENTE|nr:DNA replication initiation protein [Vagococcus entomophilus]
MVGKEENYAAYKLNPNRALTQAQQRLKQEILDFCQEDPAEEQTVLLVEGAAGTGKSVLLSSAFFELQKRTKTERKVTQDNAKNYLLVNHPEMLKAYKNVAETTPYLLKKDFERPTTFINRLHKMQQQAAVVFVDEAHLLLSKKDSYNHFQQENQLEEILKLSQRVVLIYDNTQVLKFKSFWDEQRLAKVLEARVCKKIQLQQQFRIEAHADVYEWIDAFCQRQLKKWPQNQSFELRVYQDAGQMYQEICKKNKEEGLSRILATYDFPYRLDGQEYFVTANHFKLRWDMSKPQEKFAWAERADTIDEVGSVYTVQGFDLNYAGIIIGPSITYNEALDRLEVLPEKYEDQAAFMGSQNVPNASQAKQQLMLNALYVIMTRARKGLFLHAVDEKLQNKLQQLAQE